MNQDRTFDIITDVEKSNLNRLEKTGNTIGHGSDENLCSCGDPSYGNSRIFYGDFSFDNVFFCSICS